MSVGEKEKGLKRTKWSLGMCSKNRHARSCCCFYAARHKLWVCSAGGGVGKVAHHSMPETCNMFEENAQNVCFGGNEREGGGRCGVKVECTGVCAKAQKWQEWR